MFVSQVPCADADAGATAALLDTLDWDGPDGLLNTLNKKVDKRVKWDASNKWNADHGTRVPVQKRYSEMPVIHHLNTTDAQKREALATRQEEESEGSDGGEEVVGGSMVGGGDGGGAMEGGSMVGGAMEGGGDGGGAMEGGAMVGGGDGGGSGGVRSEAPALAAVALQPPRTTATIKQLQAMDCLIKGEGEFADTLAEVRSGSGSFKPEDQDEFLKRMKCMDIQVNRPATLCKQCAIYSLHCVADILGTACQRRVLVISIQHNN